MVGEGGEETHNTEKGAWRRVFALPTSVENTIALKISNACELEVAICSLWCML